MVPCLQIRAEKRGKKLCQHLLMNALVNFVIISNGNTHTNTVIFCFPNLAPDCVNVMLPVGENISQAFLTRWIRNFIPGNGFSCSACNLKVAERNIFAGRSNGLPDMTRQNIPHIQLCFSARG